MDASGFSPPYEIQQYNYVLGHLASSGAMERDLMSIRPREPRISDCHERVRSFGCIAVAHTTIVEHKQRISVVFPKVVYLVDPAE